MQEFLSVDPNAVYRLQTYLRQESDITSTCHSQYMGLMAFDVDKNSIHSENHMRFYSNGIDSRTTLAHPLSPGDMQIHLTSAAGWNDNSSHTYQRGIILFGYRNQQGGKYGYYSRLVFTDLFDLAGVDKANNIITLKTPLPASAANPDDPNGTWPVGTELANSSKGGTYKYSVMGNLRLAAQDTWYQAVNHMGGIDLSGKNVTANFPPGTAYVKVFWLPNYSNRPNGYYSTPSTGPDHRIWYSGVSVTPDIGSVTHRNASGSVAIKVLDPNFASGTLSLRDQGLRLTQLN